jgi:ABC-type nickel/cobalt efflux system permease component RcnA
LYSARLLLEVAPLVPKMVSFTQINRVLSRQLMFMSIGIRLVTLVGVLWLVFLLSNETAKCDCLCETVSHTPLAQTHTHIHTDTDTHAHTHRHRHTHTHTHTHTHRIESRKVDPISEPVRAQPKLVP